MPQQRGGRPCRVSGCFGRVRGYGAYCNKHDIARRRHGHPLQTNIKMTYLRPYMERARRFMELRGADAWPLIRQQFHKMLSRAKDDLAAIRVRKVAYLYEKAALEELVKVCETVPEDELILVLLAFGILWKEEPRAFASDDAFRVQVALRLRKHNKEKRLSYVKIDGRKVVHRELPPRVAVYLGQRVIAEFVLYGASIADEMEKCAREETEQKARTIAAIRTPNTKVD